MKTDEQFISPVTRPRSQAAIARSLANPQTLVNVVVSKEDGKVVAYVECMVF